MPKLIGNPRRNDLSIDGLVNKHDEWLNQPVLTTSDVQFNNLRATGDLIVDGNALIKGSQTVVNSNIVRITDDIIEINEGNPNPLNMGGLQINRGAGLLPYYIIYDESSQTFRAGLSGNLQAIAMRPDTGLNNGVAIWNDSTKQFIPVNQVDIPFTFTENVVTNQGLYIGTASNKPSLSSDISGNLILESNSNIVLNLTHEQGALKIPVNKNLNFGTQVSLYGDVYGTLFTSASQIRVPIQGKIGWSDASYITSTLDGNTVRLTASTLDLAATTDVTIGVPLRFANIGTISADSNVLEITSTGDIALSPGPSGVVILPSLSIADGKVKFLTDVVGNLTLQTDGDITLSPLANIFIPSSKKLVFGTTDRHIKVDNNNLYITSGTKIVLESEDGVEFLSPVLIGTTGSFYESGVDTVFENSSGDIIFQPNSVSGQVVIPTNTILQFGNTEKISSNGQHLYVESGMDIVLSPGENIVVPQNKLITFGNVSNSISLNSSSELVVQSDNRIVLSGEVLVSDIVRWTVNGVSISEDAVNSNLVLNAPNATAINSKVQVLSTANGTSSTSASLSVAGSAYIANGVRIIGDSSLTGSVYAATDSFIIDNNMLGNSVVRIQNRSSTQGKALALLATFDTTDGYTIGRGSNTLISGRAMTFTVPNYTNYSNTGSKPAFYFGNDANSWYLTVDDSQTTVQQGTLRVLSNASNALQVTGTGQFGNVNTVSLTVPTLLTVDTTNGIVASGTVTVDNDFLVVSNSTNVFGVDATTGITTIYSTMSVEGSSNFQDDLSVVGTFTASTSYFTDNMSLGGNRITNLALPLVGTDAASKSYVDEVAQGLSHKVSAMATTTVNINLSDQVFVFDDVTLSPGMRVLVKDQSDQVENGIYVVQNDNRLQRAPDFDNGDVASGSAIFVTEGTLWGATGFVVTGSNLIVGTDNIIWTPYTGLSQITTGTGLEKSGNTLSIKLDGFSVETSPANELRLSSTGLGTGLSGGSGNALSTSTNQSHVTRVGVLTNGTWQANTVSVSYGGTGLTTVPNGRILMGKDSTSLKYSSLVYDEDNKRLGIGTTVPSTTIDIVDNQTAAYISVSNTNSTPQSAGLLLKQVLRQSQITLLDDGSLFISQDDSGSTSKIRFATGGGNTRMTIDDSGKVMIGTDVPDGSYLFTIAGSASLGNTKVSNTLSLGTFGVFSARPGSTTDTLLTTARFYLSNGFEATSDSRIGNLSLLTSSSETVLQSVNQSTGLGLPLHFKQSGSFVSATCSGNGFLVPNALQIGGTYDDPTTGYKVQLLSNNLEWSPGTASMEMLFNGNVQFTKDIKIYNSNNTSNVIKHFVSDNNYYTQATVNNMIYNFGVGGDAEVTTVIGNTAGTNFIKYDPTISGGTFTISSGTTTQALGNITYHKSLIDDTTKGVIGSVANNGWFYLGTLGVGKTTICASNAWTIRLNFDGVASYSTSLTMYTRNIASLVIYKIGSVYHLFIYVYSAPVYVQVYESYSILVLGQFEGTGVSPDGSYSGLDETWVKDYDSNTAQATSTIETGTIIGTGTASLSSLTTSGTATIGSTLTVNGNSTFTGTQFDWLLPFGSLASLTSDVNQNNTFTLFAQDSSSASLVLDRTSLQASLSINSITALQYPGSLVISHHNAQSQSQIVFSTRNTPRMVVNNSGTLSILSTTDTTGSSDGALIVSGGLQVSKRIHTLSQLVTPELVLRNVGAGTTATVSCTAEGNITIGNKRLVSIGQPVNPDDAVTKSYVDLAVQGTSAKESVLAASTGNNVNLSSPLTTLDGITVPIGSRVLIKDQSNAVENGIYVTQNGTAPIRSDDLSNGSHASSVFVFVSQGSVNNNSGWLCSTSPDADIVGVNALTFVQFSGAGQIIVGAGLTKTGNQIDLVPDNWSIEIASGALRIKSTTLGTGLSGGSGQPITVSSISHLDTLGTIHEGTWEAGVIDMAYGGTGSSAFAANRIPFSNGLQLTQGSLVFDSDNVRLGINTLTPTHGLTIQDRNIQLTRTASGTSNIIFTSSPSNYSFSMRQNGTQLVWASGLGNDHSTLTDRMFIDSTGVLNSNYGIVSPFATLGTNYKFTGTVLERTNSGVMQLSLFSNDNTGAFTTYYGGLGTSSSFSNSEFMRVGFYNGSYTVSTSSTGTGSTRSITLQTGTNTGQWILRSDGNIDSTAAVNITNTTGSTSITSGGAFTVAGGAAFNGTVYAQQLRLTSTSDSSLIMQGGFAISNPLTFLGLQNYQILSSSNTNGMHLRNSTTGIPYYMNIYNYDSEGALDTKLRVFATGRNITDDAEWLTLGYDVATTSYHVLSENAGTGILRNLQVGVGTVQQTFTQSGVTFSSNVTLEDAVVVSSTQDASSASNGGALTVSGGLAVSKTVIVGSGITTPVTHITDKVELSAAGSSDRIITKYVSTGQLHFYNTSSTRLVIHAGGSTGPGGSDTEFLSLGYANSNAYSIISGVTGAGTLRDIILQTGSNTNQLRLTTTGAVSTSGAFSVTNTTNASSISTGSLTTAGGVGIGKSLYVGGAVYVGSGSSGNVMTLNGPSTWSFTGDSTNSRLALKASAVDDDLFITGSDDSVLFSVSQQDQQIILGFQSVVKATHVKAFNVQDGSGNDAFYIDTVNGVIDIAGNRIVNAGAPLVSSDLATKAYVDNLAKGLNLKEAVIAASTTNTNVNLLNPVYTLDDISLVPGYRVLLKNQTNAVENGIYVVGMGNYLSRASDMATGSRSAGVFTFIQQGTVYADSGYVVTSDYPNDVVGTDSITWTQFNGNVISAGSGLFKDANNVLHVSLDPADDGLDFNANKLRINPNIAGDGLSYTNGVIDLLPITSTGIITEGTWRATPIEFAFGGTGNTNFPTGGIVYSSGTNLISDANNFIFDNSKKSLAIGTSTADPNNQGEGLTIAKDIAMYGTSASLYLGASGVYNWRVRRADAGSGLAHVVFSHGSTSNKDSLTDTIIFTSGGKVGIGYTLAGVGSITDTLDIQGTVHVTGAVTLDTALTVANGGTGATSLAYGLLIGNGTGAITTTGTLADGAVPIGTSGGTIALESGSTLRQHIGLAIGTNVQAYSANLDVISGLTPSSNAFIVGNGTAFTTVSGGTARTALGLGSLAVLSTINNSLWSGAALTVGNGGTGSTSFVDNSIVYYSSVSGTMVSTGMYWDNTNSGLGIGLTGVTAANGIQIYAKDMSIQTDDNVNGNFGLNFQNVNGNFVWRMRRQDSGAGTGAANLVFAGGIPSATRTGLTDRVTIYSNGNLSVHSTVDTTSTTTGSLVTAGGMGIAGSIVVGGDIKVQSATTSTSTGTGSIVTNGGVGISGNLYTGGVVIVQDTTDSTSTTSGALVISGGIGTGGRVTMSTLDVVTATSESFLGNLRLIRASSINYIESFANKTSDSWSPLRIGSYGEQTTYYLFDSTLFTVNPQLLVANTTDSTNTTTGALQVAGGFGIAKKLFVGDSVTLTKSATSLTTLTVENTNNDTAAGAQVLLRNDTVNSGTLFLNSSGATGEGGASTMTLRNNAGNLRLQALGSVGVTIAGTSGNVTTSGNITVQSTTEATSSTNGGSLTVGGGMAVAKKLFVGGDLVVSGTISGSGNTSSPSVTTGNYINTSGVNVTVSSASLIRNDSELTFSAMFIVVPTAGSLITSFTFELPNKISNLTNRWDIVATISGWTDDTNLITVQNTVCTGVASTTNAVVLFEARDTSSHYLSVIVRYNDS